MDPNDLLEGVEDIPVSPQYTDPDSVPVRGTNKAMAPGQDDDVEEGYLPSSPFPPRGSDESDMEGEELDYEF